MNRRAALDAAFLVKQLAGQREPFHASLVSQILGRQSLAEIPVDHSRGLRDALEHAKDCKSLLRAGSDLSVEALVQFVKAFVTSPFCLEPLEEVAERLKHTLDLVMHSHVKQHGHQPWPHVCKAAKLIMIGFKMIGVPPLDEVVPMLVEESCGYREWMHPLNVHGLTLPDLQWALSTAAFKTCYRLALQGKKDSEQLVPEHYIYIMEENLSGMVRANELHPLTLQSCVQAHMLLESDDQPAELGWDSMRGKVGYDTALKRLGDPALAANHLVQTMYTNLQATGGHPSYQQQQLLLASATSIMHVVDYLQQEPLLWECVRGNILASLFMLARIWDLAFFLDNHALVSFIYEQYALQRALLRQPVLTPEPTQEDDFEDMDEEVMSLMAKVKSREDRQWVDLRCTRCDRRIQTKEEAIECQQCHSAFYCSPECQRKHAQSHKGPCKRAKLKAKLAAKPNAG